MRFSSCYHIAVTALVVVVLSSPNANAFQNNHVQQEQRLLRLRLIDLVRYRRHRRHRHHRHFLSY